MEECTHSRRCCVSCPSLSLLPTLQAAHRLYQACSSAVPRAPSSFSSLSSVSRSIRSSFPSLSFPFLSVLVSPRPASRAAVRLPAHRQRQEEVRHATRRHEHDQQPAQATLTSRAALLIPRRPSSHPSPLSASADCYRCLSVCLSVCLCVWQMVRPPVAGCHAERVPA